MKTNLQNSIVLFFMLVLVAPSLYADDCHYPQLPRLPDDVTFVFKPDRYSHTPFRFRSKWGNESFGTVTSKGVRRGYEWRNADRELVATASSKYLAGQTHEVLKSGERMSTFEHRIDIFDCAENLLGAIVETVTRASYRGVLSKVITVVDQNEIDYGISWRESSGSFDFNDYRYQIFATVQLEDRSWWMEDDKVISLPALPDNPDDDYVTIDNRLLGMFVVLLEQYKVDSNGWFLGGYNQWYTRIRRE